jgi:hypothetical protein
MKAKVYWMAMLTAFLLAFTSLAMAIDEHEKCLRRKVFEVFGVEFKDDSLRENKNAVLNKIGVSASKTEVREMLTKIAATRRDCVVEPLEDEFRDKTAIVFQIRCESGHEKLWMIYEFSFIFDAKGRLQDVAYWLTEIAKDHNETT